MSEPMFPNSAGGAPAQEPVEAPKSNRTTLLAVGGVLAALVVAGLAFMMLSSGGGDEAADSADVASAPVVPAAPAAPTAAPSQAVVKPASVTVAKRNPFEPLYPAPAPAATTGGSTSGGSADPAHPTSTPEPVTPAVSLTVTTIDTAKQVATVGVDGKKYPKLAVGDSFGGFYTLYSIFNDQCVGVLYGDQSVPVCLNKPVSVTP